MHDSRVPRACLPLVLVALAACGSSTAAPAPAPTAHAQDAVPARAVRPSAGCGIEAQGSGGFASGEIVADDVTRTYRLFVPAHYDASRPHALVFRWHGTGGDGSSGGLDVEKFSGDGALVVAADGIDKRWGPWEVDRNVALFDALYARITATYCIDLARVYSYGFSAGGALSNQLACVRGDLLRASAAVSSRPSDGTCRGPVAAWFLHDENDDVIPFEVGQAARDRAVAQNHCKKPGPTDGEGCVRYEGCDPGAPVVFCASRGFGHDIRGDFAPQRVWSFFSSLP